jgi:hypothetical protein
MEVKFADTFFESFKKMLNRERWYWKTWDFLRYDLSRFFRNIWKFRKAIYNYRWYSGHHGILPFIETAVTDISTNVDIRGNEIRETSEKKVAKMKRASEIMRHFIEEDFVDLAEKELGPLFRYDWEFEDVPEKPGFVQIVEKETIEEKAHNSKVYARAREIEAQMWKELWKIFEGQDPDSFEPSPDGANHNESYDHWKNQFDGSGMRGWWD